MLKTPNSNDINMHRIVTYYKIYVIWLSIYMYVLALDVYTYH